MIKYPILFFILASAQTLAQTTADRVNVIDERTLNPAPSSFSREVRFDFKHSPSFGSPYQGSSSIDTYSALMTIAPWSDNTGPKHHQINFSERAIYWRKGHFGSAWEPWYRILTTEANGRLVLGGFGTARSSNGIVLGGDQNSIEFVHSDYGQGYGARIYGSDDTNGVTSLRIAVRGNTTTWNDAVFVNAGNIYPGSRAGYVGIGTNDPVARFHSHEPTVLGSTLNDYRLISRTSGASGNHFAQNTWLVRDTQGGSDWITARIHEAISIDGSYGTPRQNTATWWERDPHDNVQEWGNSNQVYMTLKSGLLGLGTQNPDERLTVKGKIHTEEVRVDMTVPGPDYVFEPDYVLTSLSELDIYIKANKHLPEVPSAKEMATDGLNLKEMNLILLKKVEELTLHLIATNKMVDQQSKEINDLRQTIDTLAKKE